MSFYARLYSKIFIFVVLIYFSARWNRLEIDKKNSFDSPIAHLYRVII